MQRLRYAAFRHRMARFLESAGMSEMRWFENRDLFPVVNQVTKLIILVTVSLTSSSVSAVRGSTAGWNNKVCFGRPLRSACHVPPPSQPIDVSGMAMSNRQDDERNQQDPTVFQPPAVPHPTSCPYPSCNPPSSSHPSCTSLGTRLLPPNPSHMHTHVRLLLLRPSCLLMS